MVVAAVECFREMLLIVVDLLGGTRVVLAVQVFTAASAFGLNGWGGVRWIEVKRDVGRD